ncbi:uncharacterized protein PHACADRAFT_184278 [Phanerochaete carnosa HHB-10118-sp]|uniref:TOG domain-containing protein n=1 Tax=Phanerochaete carnosa (strain HHB-10118-sp) TaxID=650164 RepID=K5WYA8_PHACS|nr:uncharacterized protein PHACADRAFT_184278 [Phanerochaete carnosa HHB-10118-sp]EKM55487.1 hypothetical protein PHACADRAFT_184278 [Phanerochaete carnosa HHB-10118-sp]
MGIILSLLFPRHYMFAEQSVLSSPSSTTSSSPATTLGPDQTPPTSPLRPSHRSPTITESRRSDAQLYVPHAVGLGLVGPRAHRGSMSPFVLDAGAIAQAKSPPVVQASSFEEEGSAPLQPPQEQHPNQFDDSASMSPSSPSLTSAQASAANSMYFRPSTSSIVQRPSSPGASTSEFDIAIPAAHYADISFVTAGTAMSPPASGSSLPTHHPETSSDPILGGGSSLDLVQEVPLPPAGVGEGSLDVDFTEFDSEGLSALEKIYLFSRSRAGFQRIFIAHALPSFLSHRRESLYSQTEQNEDSPATDEITPAEAVEYVLPLLNSLATDEDEAVKEALAAELVPIIWWFITHCQLVEEDDAEMDQSTQLADEPTRIAVQSFTPILGTLLLSPNGLVGGPARFAVVELLNRVKRADAKDRRESQRPEQSASGSGSVSSEQREGRADVTIESGQDSDEEDGYSPTGLFGSLERLLFEREILQQVVIGMGRLDLPDEHAQSVAQAGEIVHTSNIPTPVSTAHVHHAQGDEASYFPAVNPRQSNLPVGNSSTPSATAQQLESPPSLSQPSSPWSSDDASPSSIHSISSLSSADYSPSSINSGSISSSQAPITPPNSVQDTLLASEDAKVHHSSHLASPPLVKNDDLRTPEVWDFAHSASILGPRPQSPHVVGSPPYTLHSLSPRPPSPPLSTPRPPGPRPSSPTLPDKMSHAPVQSSVVEPGFIPVELHPPFIPDMASTNSVFASGLAYHTSHENTDISALQQLEEDDETIDEAQLSEEASVGRLSSMSLMAAVTASGSIDEETKAVFVAEVERVGRDPVYWVRREASFAVGALAKVVPQEVVLISLLPLIESFYRDSSWHVRHSALFALPAILSRLPPQQRRSLALDVILTLARDELRTVRTGVLEALAEVMYTFHEDADGPPDKLLRLFLGVREPDDPRLARQKVEESSPSSPPATPMSWSEFVSSMSAGSQQSQDYDIYEDPSRPLVCAFNYPAVALTLGRERWHEIRELYLTLSQNPSLKVRRTLAASLGEMAKIVGAKHAKQDLLHVWRSSARSEEGEIRLKALECLETFVPALEEAERAELLRDLNGEVWTRLRGWREREAVIKALGGWASISAIDENVLRGLLRKGLQDPVASVREEAVHALAAMVSAWANRSQSLERLWDLLRTLAISNSYRYRMVFLSCFQTILLATKDVGLVSNVFVKTLESLSCDPIVDVRIRLARFLGTLLESFPGIPEATSQAMREIAKRLAEDSSHDVKAFARSLLAGWSSQNPRKRETAEATKSAHIFSRPPPLAPS